MTYATLLVHLQSGQSNTSLLTVAGQFADRFKAHVIGIAACQPMMIVSGDGTICGDVFADDQRQITTALEAAQSEFREALRDRSTWLEWRSEITIAAPASYLSVHARSADLIMTGSVPADTFDLSRIANPGSLVMEAGRPVFIVPPDAQPMRFGAALIGWKDTRECRRATADALPLLKQTERVTVLEVAAIDDLDAAQARVEDVVHWLERHGVMADCRVARASGQDVDQLHAAADESDVDFIVAGAYGHGRLREWVLGGVTRDLLLECRRGVLVSH
jgi:nucleotide-binding universal stress UspA family protein